MITRGQVRAVREMGGPAGPRVQAEVCLAASTSKGSAVVKVELKSKAVLDALSVLKKAIAEETMDVTQQILKDQMDWDREKAARASMAGEI